MTIENEMENLDWDLIKDPDLEERQLASQAELKKLCIDAATYKNEIDYLEDKIEILKKPYNEILEQIQKTLEFLEIENLSAQGYKFSLKRESSVKTPKTIEEKRAFFNYLESIGMFYELATVNSRTLQSTYKALAEQALKDGILDFQVPGISPATEYNVLKVKKEK